MSGITSMSTSMQSCKVLILLLCCLISQHVLSATGAEKQAIPASSEKLTVMALANFPPHYQIGKDGKPTGFAIDVMEHIARIAGFEVDYYHAELWIDGMEALEQGKVDIIPNLGITPERQKKFATTRPLETFPIGLFTRDASKEIEGIDNLTGRRVAVVEGNVGERIMKGYPGIETLQYTDKERALFALMAGEVDGFVYPIPVTWQLAQALRIDDHLRQAGAPLLEIKRGMAVRRDNRELLQRLDLAVAEFLDSDEYQRTYEHWFSKPVPYWNARRILTIGGSTAVALLLLTILGMTVWRYLSTMKLNTELKQSIAQRDMAQQQLEALNDKLEIRVRERTEELSRFKSTLDQTMDCVFMFDPQTLRFFYVNEGAMQQVGYSLTELMAMTPLDIKPEFDEPRFRAISESLIRGPVHSLTFETVHRHKDGHDTPVEIFLQYLAPTDTPPRFLAIVRDITERRQAEEEREQLRCYLNEMLDAMPSIVVGVDKSGVVTHWNREAVTAIGTSAEQAIGRPVSELLPMLTTSMKDILAAVASGKAMQLSRMSYQYRNENRHADVLVYPLTAVGIEGAVIRIDDVTERARMEEMMVQTEKMLSVGGLAGGMAHELNNPIGGMVQGLQNIRRRLSSEVAKNIEAASRIGINLEQLQQYMSERQIDKLFETVANAGGHASDIVNNMLQFSRKSEMETQSVRLDELIDQTVELAAVDYDLKKKFDFRSIEFERDYQPGLPPLECIPGEIQQVILNLLRNAAQAMSGQSDRTEPPRISLRAVQDGERLRIDVEDNGPGMDEETARRAFEPFYSTKPPGQGTGLGLSVSYYIIHDEHGGEMKVESTPGKGTKFFIQLPVIHQR